MAGDVLDVRGLREVTAGVRRLPTDLRAELRRDVVREVVQPVARQVSHAAGAAGNPFARAFRNAGVTPKPGQDTPQLVLGGPAGFGSHGARMRTIAAGAEFGGSRKRTTYTRRHAKGRRRSSGTIVVRRATTVGFGTHTGREGRFFFPTFRRELPRMTAAYLAILDRVAGKLEAATRG